MLKEGAVTMIIRSLHSRPGLFAGTYTGTESVRLLYVLTVLLPHRLQALGSTYFLGAFDIFKMGRYLSYQKDELSTGMTPVFLLLTPNFG
jgi:hypothetical protein